MIHINPAADIGHTTDVPVIATQAGVANCHPQWIRLPKGGSLCSWTGLSRSKMNELVLPCPTNAFNPPVKSSVLRQKDSLKGVRLIHLQSLLEFIESKIETASRPKRPIDNVVVGGAS